MKTAIDSAGRIVIPKKLRDLLGLSGGEVLEIRECNGVLELEPDSFQARYNLGVTYGSQGLVDVAVAFYQEALEVAPDHPEAVLIDFALGAADQGDVEQGVRIFRV